MTWMRERLKEALAIAALLGMIVVGLFAMSGMFGG